LGSGKENMVRLAAQEAMAKCNRLMFKRWVDSGKRLSSR
jgi:hypothetical protein